MEMRRYKSIRVVQAFQIAAIENGKLRNESGEWIKPVSEDFFQRHSPYVGAWFIIYPDGYQSICPDESFREGYRLLDERGERSSSVAEMETAGGSSIGPVVYGEPTLLQSVPLTLSSCTSLLAAGFQTVGEFRAAVVSKLQDGGCVQDLPGVTPENSAEIERVLLNDRGPGNYLTGESAGEVPVAETD